MKITAVNALEILDSRGVPTVQVTLVAGDLTATFGVPAGKSTGDGEAKELRDGGERYGGQGVQTAITNIEQLAAQIIGRELGDQADFDHWLITTDGTPDKSKLGANAMLALSGAYLRLAAVTQKKELWQLIAEMTGSTPGFPRLYSNLVNGGKHAPGLDVQEFVVVPISTKPSVAIEQVSSVYRHLSERLVEAYGPTSKLVGDEGGFAPSGAKTHEIWKTLRDLAPAELYDLACDVAASSFAEGNIYNFDGGKLHAAQLADIYAGWVNDYGLLSIEDPFAEHDEAGFSLLHEGLSAFVVGDDLTVTSADLITKYAEAGLIGGVIIKPNQIGTVTETLAAIKAAVEHSIKVIISHRSGETNDSFVADLAYGVGAFGLKLGAPARGERLAKYNRLLEIERSLS